MKKKLPRELILLTAYENLMTMIVKKNNKMRRYTFTVNSEGHKVIFKFKVMEYC